MVNITLTVPEDLKAEMDKYQEVNWSDVFRRGIQSYIQLRQNPVPNLDCELKAVRMSSTWASSVPVLLVFLSVKNQMTTDIVVDRILMDLVFYEPPYQSEVLGGLHCQYFQFRHIPANSSSVFEIEGYPDERFIELFTKSIQKTFTVEALTVSTYVQGFVNPKIASKLQIRIPFDEWKEQAESALGQINAKRARMSRAKTPLDAR